MKSDSNACASKNVGPRTMHNAILECHNKIPHKIQHLRGPYQTCFTERFIVRLKFTRKLRRGIEIPKGD